MEKVIDKKEARINELFLGKVLIPNRLLEAGNYRIRVGDKPIIQTTTIQEFAGAGQKVNGKTIQIRIVKRIVLTADSDFMERMSYSIELDDGIHISRITGYYFQEETCVNYREHYRSKKPTKKNFEEYVEKLLTAATE